MFSPMCVSAYQKASGYELSLTPVTFQVEPQKLALSQIAPLTRQGQGKGAQQNQIVLQSLDQYLCMCQKVCCYLRLLNSWLITDQTRTHLEWLLVTYLLEKIFYKEIDSTCTTQLERSKRITFLPSARQFITNQLRFQIGLELSSRDYDGEGELSSWSV